MASVTVSSPLMANSPTYPNRNHYSAVRVSAPEIQEIADKLQQIHFQLKLNIEVVDDTALIDAPLISKGKNQRQELNHRKRNHKRKGRKQVKFDKIATVGDRISDKKALVAYSRGEMLALNSEGVESKKKWEEVYSALDASVAAEYDGLVSSAAHFLRNLINIEAL